MQQKPKDHEAFVAQKEGLGTIVQVEIKVIPRDQMRYDTCGDWQVFAGDRGNYLVITVAELEDPRYHMLVAFHELVEALACIKEGITPEMVDDFDIHGPGALLDDPGRDLRAPYHKQHILAEALEHNLANHLGVNWAEYDKAITETTYGNEATDARTVRLDREHDNSAS